MSLSYSQCSQTITSYDNKEKHKFSALTLTVAKKLGFAICMAVSHTKTQNAVDKSSSFWQNECTQVFTHLPPISTAPQCYIAQLMMLSCL